MTEQLPLQLPLQVALTAVEKRDTGADGVATLQISSSNTWLLVMGISCVKIDKANCRPQKLKKQHLLPM